MTLAFAAVGALYTVLAWRLGRTGSRRALVLGWLASASVVAVLASLSALRNLSFHRTVSANDVLSFIALYLLVFGVALGAATWFVNRRLKRAPDAPLGPGLVIGGVLSFFGGLIVLAMPVLVWDASRLF
jgi:hypothetical protein